MKKPAKVKENGPQHWHIPPLAADGHKYTRGHLLVYGGAVMTGAARLAALAAQRAGAGLVTLAVPAKAWSVYAASMLSVIVRMYDARSWAAWLADDRINPVILGPGAGADARLALAMRAAALANKTLILDADALRLLASRATLRQTLRGCSLIITPHEGEYAALAAALKLDPSQAKPIRALAMAKALGAVVVFKGATTIIADAGGQCLANQADAPWLATGGTGDVLAGIIGGLVAQGMPPFDAAAAGVWLHSEAARAHGAGMIAEDLLAEIPGLLRGLV